MDPIGLILLLILLALPAFALIKSYSKKKKIAFYVNQLPGPKSYPIFGTSYAILRTARKDKFAISRQRVKKFAPLFRSWFGGFPVVHLLKPEHVEIVMGSSVNITKGPMYKFIKPWLGEGLLTSTGSKWHRNRKLITPTFHFKILDNFQEVFDEKSQILVNKLSSKADGKVFDIYPYITHCALDIICETAMGVQVNAMESSHSEYIRAIYGISEMASERNHQAYLHSDFIFKLSSTGKVFQKHLDILHGFTNKVIKDRKEALRQSKSNERQLSTDDLLLGKKARRAFLDLLIEASQNGTVLSDTDIREEVDTFMFEGHDTTTAGICWSLFLLGNNSEVQERAFQELDDIFQGEERQINMRDLGEMKYLERVIKESLRLYPSVPFIARTLTEDIDVDGHKIPASCGVVLHIYDVHRDSRFFPEPERFDPDRFLPENAKSRHPYAYIPFSAGPRNCIGQKFALNEEKTVLATILRKYKIRSAETQANMKLMSELILRPQEGIMLSLEPRNSVS